METDYITTMKSQFISKDEAINALSAVWPLSNSDYVLIKKAIETTPTADVVLTPRWIPVDERLPAEGEFVLIYVGECQVARLEKGISIADRNRMKEGVIADPIVGYSDFDKQPVKRSDVFKRCDEQGNNKVSYIWIANGGPMQWFGQYATHWMPLPQPPKEGGGEE